MRRVVSDGHPKVTGSKIAIALVRALLTHRGRIFRCRWCREVAAVSASEASVVVKQLEGFGVLRLPIGRPPLVALNEQS
jgi:hypothetical protein